jgi:hypothetical protein
MSQKLLEFGALREWTALDCTQNWTDVYPVQTTLNNAHSLPSDYVGKLDTPEELDKVLWTAADIKALQRAHQYWFDDQFAIISAKMPDFGATQKWTARQCARKWAEIHPEPPSHITSDHLPPPPKSPPPYVRRIRSPIDAPVDNF